MKFTIKFIESGFLRENVFYLNKDWEIQNVSVQPITEEINKNFTEILTKENNLEFKLLELNENNISLSNNT